MQRNASTEGSFQCLPNAIAPNAMSSLCALVLAAGHGKRMKSTTPKVLHRVAGRPLVHYPVARALEVGATQVVVVVGHDRERVAPYLQQTFGDRVALAMQEEQKGTGHAALQGLPALAEDADPVLILCGDTPLLLAEELLELAKTLDRHPNAPLAMLTCTVEAPQGYGRILRDIAGNVACIREDRDLDDAQKAVREVNPGVYCVRRAFLKQALASLLPNNAQGELYLTDIVAQAASHGGVVDLPGDPSCLIGVNDRSQLAEAERLMQERVLARLRKQGVTVGAGAYVDDTVTAEPDAAIEAHAVLRGSTHLAAGARIDVGSVIENAWIGQGALVKPYCVITDSIVEASAQIGPFAHVRPQSVIGEGAHVGNFVETKKTVMGRGAKANHLAYLGDGDIGEGANIGAGTIFCNYDGVQKHKTTIGKGAFIGSDSQLVAPVEVGENAYVATGTTVTRNVPADALAIARVRQENKDGYASKLRSRMRSAKEQQAADKAAGKG